MHQFEYNIDNIPLYLKEGNYSTHHWAAIDELVLKYPDMNIMFIIYDI